jgi:hypothetical protein
MSFDFAQLESGPFPTSYIPTTGAAAARSSDVAIITSLTGIRYNNIAGSLLIEFNSVVTAASMLNGICGFDDGTNNNRIIIRRDASVPNQYLVANLVGGGTSFQSNTAANSFPNTDTAFHKAAFAFKSTGANIGAGICVLDGSVGGQSSTSYPTTITQLQIGSGQGVSSRMTGHFKRLIYYPRSLPNVELQRLTT